MIRVGLVLAWIATISGHCRIGTTLAAPVAAAAARAAEPGLLLLEAADVLPRAAAAVLPFRFMLAFPTEVLAGLRERHEAIALLGWQWLYVAAAAAASLAVWRAGVRRFSAFGG